MIEAIKRHERKLWWGFLGFIFTWNILRDCNSPTPAWMNVLAGVAMVTLILFTAYMLVELRRMNKRNERLATEIRRENRRESARQEEKRLQSLGNSNKEDNS